MIAGSDVQRHAIASGTGLATEEHIPAEDTREIAGSGVGKDCDPKIEHRNLAVIMLEPS